jgi:hypothetical protein
MAKRKIQWHPLLGRLLRHRVEGYYELLTNMPVGDLPRQADIVLLRRTTAREPPFRGLWRFLTPWNVLEYKGPTVQARIGHLALLVEVGLGIHRRLNAQRDRPGKRPMPEAQVSFWYLANRLGPGFLEAAKELLGTVQPQGSGVWRSTVLGHPCFLVSAVDLPVDDDSLPLHVLGVEPAEKQRAVGEFVIEKPERLDFYGSLFGTLHPIAWEEVIKVAKAKGSELDFDMRPMVKHFGWKRLIEKLGKKELVREIGIDDFLANLSPAERKRLIQRLNTEPRE